MKRKDFKLAQIVPVSHLELTKDNQYHMSLAHLILSNKKYADFYKRMVAEKKYVLMDNGAAEGAQPSLKRLLKAYEILHPTELILPDTLCDSESTYEKTMEGLLFFKENGVNCKFMAVPQGATLCEWIGSAYQLIQIPEVTTIGVSKFLTSVTKCDDARVEAVKALDKMMKAMHCEKEIHLLGSHVGPMETVAAAKESKWVRSNDTALSYVYAARKKLMTETSARPKHEVDFINGIADENLLIENLKAHEQLLGIKDNSYDPRNKAWRV